ncbi:hypothetical protein CB7_64 [Pectobacterium phage vB_PatM_CB7]|nr:hypothetical protein CB7_64 [Pectobacterium phage vB_PatM_CB7]
MKYWVRLDKERIMADFDMEDLRESSGMDSIYLTLQLRFLVQRGEAAFPAEDGDILHGEGKVKLTDSQGLSVYTPCIVIAPVGEVDNA